ADNAPGRDGKMRDSVQDGSDGEQLAGEDEDRSDPDEHRDHAAHGRVVAELEVVANGAQVMRFGDPPHRGTDPEGERNLADAGGPDPPPRGDAVGVPER